VRPLRYTVGEDGAITPPVRRELHVLSEIADCFERLEAAEAALGLGDDPVVYEVEAPAIPAAPGHLRFVATVIHSGSVGGEAYQTRGHAHVRDSGEVYFCLAGSGWMLMQDGDGETAHLRLEPGTAVYVPPGWAHRTANDGPQDLVFVAVFYADAGHDYATPGPAGFLEVVVDDGSGPAVRPRAESPGVTADPSPR
jgi:glucose-6-phosphate isomerase, archaeal